MSRRTGAFARALAAWRSRHCSLRLVLAGLAMLAGPVGPAFAAGKDYAACFSDGKVPQAVADYSQAIALKPGNAQTYYDRGQNRGFQGDYDGAFADYAKAISLNPKDARAYADRGILWMGRHEDAAALRDFEKALSLNHKSPVAYFGRGVVRTSNADYDGAIADFDQAIKFQPDFAIVYKARSRAWPPGVSPRPVGSLPLRQRPPARRRGSPDRRKRSTSSRR